MGEYSAHLLIFGVAGLLRGRMRFACSLIALSLSRCSRRCSRAVARRHSVPRVPPADFLIVHGKIYTVDEKKPSAQSLAVRKGKIVAVGSDEQVARFRGIGTRLIDASGKLVLPAFTDSHMHMAAGGFSLMHVDLGYTIEAAYAGHLEESEGSLEVGKVADVIIIDRNIFEVDAHTISQTKVVFTIVGGKIVYEADHP